MTKEQTDKLINAVVQIKALDKIPKNSRQSIHDTEFLQHLNVIREDEIEFFHQLTKDRFDRCYYQFCFRDGKVDMWGGDTDIEVRLDNIKFPKLPEQDLTDPEINKLIVQCENVQSSIYGGLYELLPVKEFYDATYNHAESVYKGLSLTENMWEGKGVFAMLVPQEFIDNKMMLDMLVKMYEVKLEQIKSTYEKLSRIVALRLVEPGEMSRGQKDFKATEFKK